jgi:hypothetical protein
MLVFLTPLVNERPSNLPLVNPPPPPRPCANKYRVYIYSVCKRGGGGWDQVVWSIYRSYIYTVYLTRFRTYKIAFTTPNQNLGGDGASDR